TPLVPMIAGNFRSCRLEPHWTKNSESAGLRCGCGGNQFGQTYWFSRRCCHSVIRLGSQSAGLCQKDVHGNAASLRKNCHGPETLARPRDKRSPRSYSLISLDRLAPYCSAYTGPASALSLSLLRLALGVSSRR